MNMSLNFGSESPEVFGDFTNTRTNRVLVGQEKFYTAKDQLEKGFISWDGFPQDKNLIDP